MTLQTILQDVADEIGIKRPSTFVGNTGDSNAVRLLAQAKAEIRVLRRDAEWTELLKVHTFTTSNGTVKYDLPSDFRSFVNATWWDRTEDWPLIGPATNETWQTIVSGDVNLATQSWFRIIAGQIELYPVPGETNTIAFEYIADTPIDTDGDGTGDAKTWQADSDTSVLDEEVITMGVRWRMLKTLGLPYAEEYNEYERQKAQYIARDGGAPKLNMGPKPPHGAIHLPEDGFGQ